MDGSNKNHNILPLDVTVHIWAAPEETVDFEQLTKSLTLLYDSLIPMGKETKINGVHGSVI